MDTKEAAEARKQKIRNLEFSLFGEKPNDVSLGNTKQDSSQRLSLEQGVVGLPSIKSVDEYSQRYGNVFKGEADRLDTSANLVATPTSSHNQHKKRVKITSPVDDVMVKLFIMFHHINLPD